MKKILAIALALCLIFALTACSGTASQQHRLVMVTGGDAGTYYALRRDRQRADRKY